MIPAVGEPGIGTWSVPNLPSKISPSKISWLKASGKVPMDMIISTP